MVRYHERGRFWTARGGFRGMMREIVIKSRAKKRHHRRQTLSPINQKATGHFRFFPGFYESGLREGLSAPLLVG